MFELTLPVILPILEQKQQLMGQGKHCTQNGSSVQFAVKSQQVLVSRTPKTYDQFRQIVQLGKDPRGDIIWKNGTNGINIDY